MSAQAHVFTWHETVHKITIRARLKIRFLRLAARTTALQVSAFST
jgi:hypothetical protein